MKSARGRPKAVIFDLDGTITRPYLDFAVIKRQIGAGETPILEFLASMTNDSARREAREKVDRWERDGAEASALNPGVREVLAHLRSRNTPVAILTRNNRTSVEIVMRKHELSFDIIVTADDALPPKPSPEPVRHIAGLFGLDPGEVMVVGDYLYDVESGRAAGAVTVLLLNREKPLDGTGADFVIRDLRELLGILKDDADVRE